MTTTQYFDAQDARLWWVFCERAPAFGPWEDAKAARDFARATDGTVYSVAASRDLPKGRQA